MTDEELAAVEAEHERMDEKHAKQFTRTHLAFWALFAALVAFVATRFYTPDHFVSRWVNSYFQNDQAHEWLIVFTLVATALWWFIEWQRLCPISKRRDEANTRRLSALDEWFGAMGD